MLATPGMDRHSAYVGLSRHRDSVQLHYGRDDFTDQRQLTRTLSRDRGKDMAGDYAAARDGQAQARAFAERREIRFPELAREIAGKVRDKARGMFAGFKPKSSSPELARDGKGGPINTTPERAPAAPSQALILGAPCPWLHTRGGDGGEGRRGAEHKSRSAPTHTRPARASIPEHTPDHATKTRTETDLSL